MSAFEQIRSILLSHGEKNDGTQDPIWAIVKKCGLGRYEWLCGPWFSREAATDCLEVHRYRYGGKAFVYCFSCYHAVQMRQIYEIAHLGESEKSDQLAQLQAENAALKARITELESRQITEHGTVEFGGVPWQIKELAAKDGVIAIHRIRNVTPLKRRWGYMVIPDAGEINSDGADTLFAAMQAAIDYAEGEA